MVSTDVRHNADAPPFGRPCRRSEIPRPANAMSATTSVKAETTITKKNTMLPIASE